MLVEFERCHKCSKYYIRKPEPGEDGDVSWEADLEPTSAAF